MAKVIRAGSAAKYAGQNAIFSMFCLDSAKLRASLLKQWFVDNISTYLKLHKKHKYVKEFCLKMNPEDDNCPFKLSNLTFSHSSDVITQWKARKEKNHSKAMFLGNASYKQSPSALKHLFCMSKYAMQSDFFDNLPQFTKGIRQHVTNKKVQEGDVAIVGKKKMGFNVYKKICKLFMKEEGEEFIFARAFLTLEWNLMARSKNVVQAHILHIHWEDDSLVFCFVKSKGNHTGQNCNQEWHVYANPHNPEICPIHALACYIFSNPGAFSAMDEIVNEHKEDGVKVEVHKGMGQATLLLIVTKTAFFLVSSSTSNSCLVCIGLLRSIRLCFLHWTSLLEIWDLTQPGKV
jgi:hypothetical protein